MKILTVVSLLIAPAFTVSVKERLQVTSRQSTDYAYVDDVVNADLPYEVVEDGDGGVGEDVDAYDYGDDMGVGEEVVDDYYYPDGGVEAPEFEIPTNPPEAPKPVKCLEIHYVYLPGA